MQQLQKMKRTTKKMKTVSVVETFAASHWTKFPFYNRQKPDLVVVFFSTPLSRSPSESSSSESSSLSSSSSVSFSFSLSLLPACIANVFGNVRKVKRKGRVLIHFFSPELLLALCAAQHCTDKEDQRFNTNTRPHRAPVLLFFFSSSEKRAPG